MHEKRGKPVKRLNKVDQSMSDLETNLYWEFGKFTSRDGESLESYYSRFYKMMNELVRNQCHVTNHQVNVQFLLQLQPEWQRFVTLVKQSQELKTVSYHKLYDILKKATQNRGKAIVTSSAPTYDPEPATVTEDDEMYKDKDIDKLMALISLLFKKIYKPTNNNLRTPQPAENQDNSHESNKEEMGYWKQAHDMYMDNCQELLQSSLTILDHLDDEPMHKYKTIMTSDNVFAMENDILSNLNYENVQVDQKVRSAELDKYNDVNYASKVEIDCAKAKGDLMSYKIDFEKSSNAYTQKINDLNQTISDMKKELCAHQETISIMSQAKELQRMKYVAVYEWVARCYNDNLALMLAPDSDETIHLEKERRSKLSDLIRPFDYDQLNNLYGLFVPQREKSAEQHYFSKKVKDESTSFNKEFSKSSLRKTNNCVRKQMEMNPFLGIQKV
ncbi:hypothetical protein Tco_0011513 [Tanacetum coccineum]